MMMPSPSPPPPACTIPARARRQWRWRSLALRATPLLLPALLLTAAAAPPTCGFSPPLVGRTNPPTQSARSLGSAAAASLVPRSRAAAEAQIYQAYYRCCRFPVGLRGPDALAPLAAHAAAEEGSGGDGDGDNKDDSSHNETTPIATNASTTDSDANENGSGTKEDESKPPPSRVLTYASEPPGLGGRAGLTPDVNALKRNLVQEAVRAYKSELLDLLGTPPPTESNGENGSAEEDATIGDGGSRSDDGLGDAEFSKLGRSTEPFQSYDGSKTVAYYKYGPGSPFSESREGGGAGQSWATRDEMIEDKLAALVQANPVATTTDSNLLDGEWDFVFASHEARTIVDPNRFVLIRADRSERMMAGRRGGGSGGGGINDGSNGNGGPDANGKAPFGQGSDSDAANGGTTPADAAAVARPWILKSGLTDNNPLRTFSRRIHLENLRDDEDPYVIDSTRYVGGLWRVERTYDVVGLTRTALDLGLCRKELSLLGGRFVPRLPLARATNSNSRKKKKKNGGNSNKSVTTDDGGGGKHYLGRAEVQVLYLDSDLCITTTERGMDGPLLVYTKSAVWTGSKERARRKKRFLRATVAWAWSVQSPLRIRSRVASVLPSGWRRRRNDRSGDSISSAGLDSSLPSRFTEEEENRVLLRRSYGGEDEEQRSKLMVLKMGEEIFNPDGTLREDVAWDGDEDPFVHLPSMERQELLRGMTIQQIGEAGRVQVELARRRQKKRFRTQKQFKKPDKPKRFGGG